MRQTIVRLLALALLLLPATVYAQTTSTPFDLEIGYRWLDISGNEDLYRTQINERSGVLLRSFTLATTDFNGTATMFDHFRIDTSDLGAGPAGALRIDAGKSGLYSLRLGYRMTEGFSALPAFANPLLGQGIIPGQHTYDRDRKMFDADLEILPGRRIVPFVGYSMGTNKGPGTTTYHVGQDEFLLRSDLDEKDHEIRAGAGFNFGSFYGQLTQGWRSYSDDETMTLSAGAGSGNNPEPVLGTPVTATGITRKSSTDVSTPFTNAFVTGQVLGRVRLTGNYVRFAADQDGNEDESTAGSFASFEQRIFFTGLTETVSSGAKNTTWRGGARAEVSLLEGVDLIGGFQRQHRNLSGTALINTLFLQAVTFGGVSQGTVTDVLDTNNSLQRDEDVFNVAFSARSMGPFAIRAGYTESQQDVTVTPDLSEIVVPGDNQGGKFDRQIQTWDATGTFTKSGLTLIAAFRRDQADHPVLRSDFLGRERFRGRAAWASPKKLLRAGFGVEQINQDNHGADFAYDAKNRSYSADFEVSPIQAISVRGAYSQFWIDSNILYRLPQNFNLGTSVHKEKGQSVEAGVNVAFKPVSLDAAYLTLENKGDVPFDIGRYRTRFVVDLPASFGIAAEWDKDRYEDKGSLPLSDFDANRYGIYLRWVPR